MPLFRINNFVGILWE